MTHILQLTSLFSLDIISSEITSRKSSPMPLIDKLFEICLNSLSLIEEYQSICDKQQFLSFYPTRNGVYARYETQLRPLLHYYVLLCSISSFGYSCHENLKLVANTLNDSFDLLFPGNIPFFQIPGSAKSTNFSNGCIGFAWIIEALSFSKNNYPPLSINNKNLEESFKFSNRSHVLYSALSNNNYDFTMNHQAWLFASLAELYLTSNMTTQLHKLLDSFDQFIRSSVLLRHSNIFSHNCSTNLLELSPKKQCLFVNYNFPKNKLIEKEIGYHFYSLIPFAKILYICSRIGYYPRRLHSLVSQAVVSKSIVLGAKNNPFHLYNNPLQDVIAIYVYISSLDVSFEDENLATFTSEVNDIIDSNLFHAHYADRLKLSIDPVVSILRSYHISCSLCLTQH
jgi:hypothetical protein